MQQISALRSKIERFNEVKSMLEDCETLYEMAKEEGRYDRDLLFVAQDIDPVVAKMCYIQLSLLGCAGYVAIGDSLANDIGGSKLFPSIGEGDELWFTPMWFTPVWQGRRELERLKAQSCY